MKWRTAVSVQRNGELFVRGKPLSRLADGSRTFTEAAFFVLRGTLPNENERKLLDAVLVSLIEHGIEPPSAFAARVSASAGNAMNAALAAGLLASGDRHGGAIEEAAKFLQSGNSADDIVRIALQTGSRVAGYGHKIYKKEDPRAVALIELATALGLNRTFISRAREIEHVLRRETEKELPLNIDGAVAAIISELGFDWRLGKAFFALGRLPGIIAHAHEEMVNERTYRRLDSSDVEYIGPETETI